MHTTPPAKETPRSAFSASRPFASRIRSPHEPPAVPGLVVPPSPALIHSHIPIGPTHRNPFSSHTPTFSPSPRYSPHLQSPRPPQDIPTSPGMGRVKTTEIEKGVTGHLNASDSEENEVTSGPARRVLQGIMRMRSPRPTPIDDLMKVNFPVLSEHEEKLAQNLSKSHNPKVEKRARMTHRMTTNQTGTGDPDELLCLDPDDPRITGVAKGGKDGVKTSTQDAQQFIMALAKALIMYGAPSHRIESQLEAISVLLRVKLQVVYIPGVAILCFGGSFLTHGAETRFVKASTHVNLGKLRSVHQVYKNVVHGQAGVVDSTEELRAIIDAPPIYGLRLKLLLAALSGATISAFAFKGSVLDLIAAGLCCGVIAWFNLVAAKQHALFANVVEISSAVFIAFAARGLSSIPTGVFCYSAIASAGIAKLLPKYLIICGALELASKQIITGAVKMVYAIIWSLFIGFSATLGSDLYFLIDSSARARRNNATSALLHTVTLDGSYLTDHQEIGTFHFTNYTSLPSTPLYSARGCYRDPDWPWYMRTLPWWTLFFLVPLYGVFSALTAAQPWKNRELPVMVLISCCSYGANRVINWAIPSRGDVSSAVGAFIIGYAKLPPVSGKAQKRYSTLGHLYSRVFHGTAFIVMFNGIGFLVPGAITATGGYAGNYRGKSEDQYSSSLTLGLRMITVAIGTTVGLYTSTLAVYSFGRQKRGALFAF